MARFNDTTVNGNLSVSGSASAQSFHATSDRRLKTNITEYTPKKSVLNLNVYEYDFISNNEHTIGCMADELMNICPEIVKESEGGTLMIEETKLIYLLLAEIKKLKITLDEMRGQHV